jgi:hypothetical protein
VRLPRPLSRVKETLGFWTERDPRLADLEREEWRRERERLQREDSGRRQVFARGMRQAADRDGLEPEVRWRPGPVPSPREIRRTERARQAQPMRDMDARRARVLGRAMEQSLAHDRGRWPQ